MTKTGEQQNTKVCKWLSESIPLCLLINGHTDLSLKRFSILLQAS